MTRTETFILLSVIVLVSTMTQIATDIYTPSLPAIAHYFKTTLGQSQFTLVYFMAGVGITTLIYGPISEGIGRRRTLVIGLLISSLAMLICLSAKNIEQLQLGRFFQGCGLGACNALWRSIFRDSFSGKELVRMSSYLVAAITLSVIISPFIGGFIEEYWGWKATFSTLLGWTILVFIVVLIFFKETSQHHDKSRLSFSFIRQAYIELISDRRFMGYCLMSFLTYGGLFSAITALPMILINGVGVSPMTFGYLMMLGGLSTGISSVYVGKLVKRLELETILLIGMSLMAGSGILLMIIYEIFGLTIYTVIIPFIIFIFGYTFIFMNCFALAFENVGHIAGYAGSLYSCIKLLGGVLFGSALGHLSTNSPLPMGIMFLASGVFSLLAYKRIVPQSQDIESAS